MAGNSVIINIIAKIKGLSEVEGFKNKLSSLTTSKGFKQAALGFGLSAGNAAWNALGGAVEGALQWMADGIGVASDLAEAMSKAEVIFGDSTDTVRDFAETAARSFGLSERAAYDATGQFGNLFKTMGMTEQSAADMSIDITKLAADLASFHNIGIEDALLKLRSGLVGEAEPMRQLGVLLNEATVKAKGLEMGLGDANGKMTEAEKVMARYALIMEQTGDAQGDFERTSGGLANQQRILAAQMENLQATIGEQLLPIMVEFAQVLNDDVLPALDGLVQAAKDNGWAFDLLGRAIAIATGGPLATVKSDIEKAQQAADEGGHSMRSFAGGLREVGQSAGGIRPGAVTGAIEKIKISATDARTAIADLSRALRTGLRGQRDNVLNTAFDAKRLPIEIRQAKREVKAARRDLEKAQTAEQKDGARIRLLDAQQNLEELSNKSRDFKADYGATGKKLGDALGGGVYESIKKWIVRSEALLAAFRANVANSTPSGSGGGTPKPSGSKPKHDDTEGTGRGRASGGTVIGGKSYIVGERGPEMFTPGASGFVTPNSMLGGSVVVRVINQISARDVADAITVRSRYSKASTA